MTNIMKILQIIPYFYPAWVYGGPVQVAYNLSKQLIKRGHEVTVYTTDSLGKDSRQRVKVLDVDGIRVYYFANLSNSLAWNHKIFFAPRMILQLSKEIRTFDIIHLHDYRTFQNIIAYHYATKNHVPYILHAHGSIPRIIKKQGLKGVYDCFFGYKLLRHASKLIAVSKEEAEHFKQMGVDDKKISIVYNGMDIKSFENLPRYGGFKEKHNINGKLILYLGRINKTKGLDFVINAFSETVKKIDATLVITGPDDGYKAELEKLIANLNLNSKVKFTGYINEQDKISAYVDANLFVHTVLYMGGVGITPLEAILCNIPVIVTDECGELVKEANCGYLVKYGDRAGLKEKMKWVIENPEEGKEMVERGKKYIYENLTWDKTAEKIENLYREVKDAII